jgi:predicted nucleic acid-binding protein
VIALDTNLISELLRPSPDPGVVNWASRFEADEFAVPAVVLAELFRGVARLDPGQRRDRLERVIGEFLQSLGPRRVVPFDATAAAHFGHILAVRERSGRPVPTMDGLIAATCRANGLALATRTGDDFTQTGIELIDPWAD